MFRKRSVKGDPHAEFQCTVRFLDDAEPIQVTFKKETVGQVVFDQVCNKLNLVEKDYFGLRYVDGEKQRHWLDPLKTVHKQLKGVNPCALCFRVKFYPSDPSKLHEEITRYYLFLQLRRDLHHGRLLCSPADANLLAAYIIQSEVGDYDEADHPTGYVSEFKMLPKQNAKVEEQIMEIHKTLSGQNPAEAEANFLKKAATLDTYGVDPHQVKEQKGTSVFLGVTHQGIMTFHGSRRTQLYKWSQIKKMPTYEGKMFIIHVNIGEDEDSNNSKKKLQSIGYKCTTVPACKYLWKCAVEQQLFFTLSSSAEKPPKVKSGGSFFSRGSKFRFSGRCQNEAFNAGEVIKRDEPNFSRTSSLPNYGRKMDPRAAKVKSMTLDVSITEDKNRKTQGYSESAVDVPGQNSKVAVAEVVPAGPVIKAPMAKPEDATIEDEVQPEEVVKAESAPKVNGSIPAIVFDAVSDELPPYEPNQTITDESQIVREVEVTEMEEPPKPSLEEQVKDLEEEFERKGSFTEPNHVEEDVKEETLVSETIQPVKSNHVTSSSSNQVNASAADTKMEPAPSTSKKVSCCKVFLLTCVFIFLTLAVVMVVLLNSNIKHPLMTQLREHLQFVNPVRDYINHQMKALFKS